MAQSNTSSLREKTDSTEIVSDDQWQLNFDLYPITKLLPSFPGRSSRLAYSFQVKRRVNENALRLSAALFPPQGYPAPTVLATSQNRVLLITHRNSQFTGRIGIGYERSKAIRIGRAYFGSDLMASKRIKFYETNSYVEYVDNNTLGGDITLPPEFSPSQMHRIDHSGLGLAPFIGLELHLTKHWGFNAEARADINLFKGKHYSINQDGTFTSQPEPVSVELYSFLRVALHYRLYAE